MKKVFKDIIIMVMEIVFIYIGSIGLYRVINIGNTPPKVLIISACIFGVQSVLFYNKWLFDILERIRLRETVINVLIVDFIILYIISVIGSILTDGFEVICFIRNILYIILFMLIDALLLNLRRYFVHKKENSN